jgi:hypothetical protein
VLGLEGAHGVEPQRELGIGKALRHGVGDGPKEIPEAPLRVGFRGDFEGFSGSFNDIAVQWTIITQGSVIRKNAPM